MWFRSSKGAASRYDEIIAKARKGHAPPPPDAALYAESMAALNARHQLFAGSDFLALAATLVEMAAAGKSVDVCATWVRNYQSPMTAHEKTAAGLAARSRIGAEFFAMLTEKGRTDPAAAAEALAYCGYKDHARACMLSLCVHSGGPVAMIVRDDAKTCTAARQWMKNIVSPQQIPVFPLPACDRWKCRCDFCRAP